jgi:hypothetical protein
MNETDLKIELVRQCEMLLSIQGVDYYDNIWSCQARRVECGRVLVVKRYKGNGENELLLGFKGQVFVAMVSYDGKKIWKFRWSSDIVDYGAPQPPNALDALDALRRLTVLQEMANL